MVSIRTFVVEKSAGFRVNRAARALAAALTASLAPQGLTPVQLIALDDIGNHPGASQREVSHRTGIDAATLAELLKRLERRGLVHRSPADGDLRRRCLTLPDEARATLDQARSHAVEVNARALSGFSPTEIRSLLDYLERIERNLP